MPNYYASGFGNSPGPQQTTDQQLLNLQRQNAQLENQYLQQQAKYEGRPDRPIFDSLRDPATGLLGGGLADTTKLASTQVDQGALGRMREEAMRDQGAPSLWRNLMQQNLTKQAGVAGAGAAGQTQAGLNRLAMTGGLRGGAAERMQTAGMQQGLEAQQKIFGQGTQLDIQDELNRQAMLGQVNQANLAQAGFDQREALNQGQFARQGQQFNIQNALADIAQRRQFEQRAYEEEMRGWAAKETAAATPSGGGGKK